jgi:glycosyltransferase involved in cell wall biosynthesis
MAEHLWLVARNDAFDNAEEVQMPRPNTKDGSTKSHGDRQGDLAALMLVSARVNAELRSEVSDGLQPCPEFLRLEKLHGVELVDWTALRRASGHRSVLRSIAHVAAALPRLRHVDVIFSDGEHVGIPLAMAMTALRISTPHLVIGHRLSARGKTLVFRWLRPYRRMDRILVHSPNQIDMARHGLKALVPRLHVVPYGIDTDFWSPQPVLEREGLVVSAGREHRDYDSLLQACPQAEQLFIADHSPHSPHARRREPDAWPANVERRALDRIDLRRMYSQASVVVVPVIDTPFPFGITTLLEAMSMGKAIVVSDTDGLRGIVEDGRTGVIVPPGGVAQLREAIEGLLADPIKRRRLGEQARKEAIERFGLDIYVAELVGHLRELGGHPTDGEDR